MGVTRPDQTHDAIVIGSGISGGWAAKELCDHGLKTLVLERGRDLQHIKDYPLTILRWRVSCEDLQFVSVRCCS